MRERDDWPRGFGDKITPAQAAHIRAREAQWEDDALKQRLEAAEKKAAQHAADAAGRKADREAAKRAEQDRKEYVKALKAAGKQARKEEDAQFLAAWNRNGPERSNLGRLLLGLDRARARRMAELAEQWDQIQAESDRLERERYDPEQAERERLEEERSARERSAQIREIFAELFPEREQSTSERPNPERDR